MKTKTITKETSCITAAQFEAAMKLYSEAEKSEAAINRQIEAEVNELLARYEDDLASLAQSKGNAFEIARSYCGSNKDTLFSKRRSIGTHYGIAGFRLGNPRLKTVKGNNWNKALEAIREKLPEYIRITEEPAKDLLLADRHKENVAPLLIEIGVEVVQDELFYIETKIAA